MKVVTAREMARIEALAIDAGCSQEAFMRQAGEQAAEIAEDWIERKELAKEIVILAGKGNKAGDAFVAGLALLEAGYDVRAYHFFPLEECSELCRKFAEKFRRKGGSLKQVSKRGDWDLRTEGLILDGLLGTGFEGKVEGILRELIIETNASHSAVLAIDVPSGLNGTTGEVGGVAIEADLTAVMGLPKVGFFLQNGWNFVGEMRLCDFGLPDAFIEQAEARAYLPDEKNMFNLLPKVVRNRHKYQAGFVVGYGGSPWLCGAPKMAALASLRAGAGLVKWFGPASAEREMIDVPLEVMRTIWNRDNWMEALKRASALFIGPGMGRSDEARHWLAEQVPQISLPCVFDADALFFLRERIATPPDSIFTPHRGEMLHLLDETEMADEELHRRCQAFCEERRIVLILKGAPTWIFIPSVKPLIVPRGDPGMATAGAGDVLTGILASLLAQKCGVVEAALLGVYLHALAGEEAAREKSSYGLIATDLIEFLPASFFQILHDIRGTRR